MDFELNDADLNIDLGDDVDMGILSSAPGDAVDAGEFEDIGQTTADLDIDLNAVADYSEELDVRHQPGFVYPAMLISGIKFNDALEVLQTAYHKCRSLCDVWIDLEDGNPPIKQGRLPADLNTFLVIRYLGLRVTLYPMKDAVRTLNLSDPLELENFI